MAKLKYIKIFTNERRHNHITLKADISTILTLPQEKKRPLIPARDSSPSCFSFWVWFPWRHHGNGSFSAAFQKCIFVALHFFFPERWYAAVLLLVVLTPLAIISPCLNFQTIRCFERNGWNRSGELGNVGRPLNIQYYAASISRRTVSKWMRL